MKNATIAALMAATIFASSMAFAEPEVNIDAARHPNLAAAQALSRQAFGKITAAKRANDFDMQGHANKAGELLEEANRELKAAAEAANAAKK